MTAKPDLRDLARRIHDVAEVHPCYSQAYRAVAMLTDHLTAMAAVNELNRKLAEHMDKLPEQRDRGGADI